MSIKLSFWVRPSQKNQDKKTPIYLRIQMDDTRTEYSIGSYVPLSNWDKKGQKVKGLSQESEAINGKLDALKARALKIANELMMSGEPFNSHTLKDKLVNGLSKSYTFDEVMNEYLEKMKSLKGKSYAQPTIIKYKNTQLRVAQYVKKRYKRNQLFLYELDYDFVDGFETFLKTEFNNSTRIKYWDKFFEHRFRSQKLNFGAKKGSKTLFR